MFYKYAAIIFMGVSLLLTGCAGVPKPAVSMVTNQDMLIAPADTADFYYAVDSAETIELAKNRALSDIASRISVSVSSSLSNVVSLSTHNNGQDISENTNIELNAIAKKIEFTGIFIEKTQNVNGIQYVLVKVSRNQLFQSYLQKMKSLDVKIKNDFAVFNKSSIFYQLKMSYFLKDKINEINEYITLLKAMRPNYDDQADRQKNIAYLAQINGIKQRAIFSITADNNSSALGSLIKRSLSAENIKLGDKNANVKLYISTVAEQKKYKTTNAKLSKLKIVNRTSTFKVQGDNGVIISNNVIKTRSASSSSVEDAIQRTKQYEKLINKQGILSFISGNQ